MRRPLFALTLAAAALAAAACSADTAPAGPTPRRPPRRRRLRRAQSAAPPPRPVGDASAAPSGGGVPRGPVGRRRPDLGRQRRVRADRGQRARGRAVHDPLQQQGSGLPHNVAIKDAGGAQKFKGELVTGPMEIDYQVPALAAGDYTFVCIVHPNMTGTLTAGS